MSNIRVTVTCEGQTWDANVEDGWSKERIALFIVNSIDEIERGDEFSVVMTSGLAINAKRNACNHNVKGCILNHGITIF
ncbi:MAG TPA: hypothetical protein VLA24_09235 [Pseudomonadales bacterium]|nr:hypothetical protein [Pseudomonadales bacterium]